MLSLLRILKSLVLLLSLVGSTGFLYASSLKPIWGTYHKGDPNTETPAYSEMYVDNSLPSLRGYSLNASACDTAGNLYIVGKDKRYAGSDSASLDCDAFVAKFSPQGELEWKKNFGSTVYDEATVIGINSKNEIYVAGWLYQDFVDKFNYGKGYSEERNNKSYENYSKLLHYKQAENFPIKYQAGAQNADTGAMFLSKLTTEGEILWSTLCGPQQINSDSIVVKMYPKQIAFTSEGDYYINGYFISPKITINLDFETDSSNLFVSMPGKTLPIFGPENAYLYNIDSLVFPDNRENYWHFTESDLTKNFLLKFNHQDSITWSTFLPVFPNVETIKIDKKGSLHICGQQEQVENIPYFPLKKRNEEAFFFQWADSMNTFFYKGALLPQLIQFNSDLSLEGSTQIAAPIIPKKDSFLINPFEYINRNASFFSTGLCLTESGTSLLYGDAHSVCHYPLVEKKGAYFYHPNDDRRYENYIFHHVILSELDSKGRLIWSSYYRFKQKDTAYNDFQCRSSQIIEDPKGGFYLLGSFLPYQSIYPVFTDYKHLFLAHFDKNRRLIREEVLPIKVPLEDEYWLVGNVNHYYLYHSRMSQKMHYFKIIPNLNLLLSPSGYLFITGNTKNIEPSLLKQPNSNSYFQSSMRSAVDQVAGFMLKLSLCDSLEKPIVWAMDSAYCEDEIIDIQLSLPADSFPSSYIYWHSSLGDSVQSDSFYIQKPGWYFSEIRSVYTDCPSFFSDTLFVDTIPIPQVNFGIDSLELCAQDRDFVLTAANPFAQYLWSDGNTDSIFQVKYKGVAEFWIWGEAYTRCGDTARDSVFVQFLPPYAYLGEDTMLCPNERFYFDIAAQNEEYKEMLAYRWKINGDTLDLSNTQGFLQIDESFGDTILLEVEVYFSLDTLCDRAFDTVQIIYYRYLNVYAFVEDTIICQSDDARFSTELAIFGPDAKAIWSKKNGEVVSQDSSVLLQEEGNYILSLKNYCSSSQDTFTLAYYPLWWTQANMPEDTFYCANQPLVLNPDVPHSSTRYRWEDLMEGQEDLWQFSASRVFDKAGNYSLELKDSAGCMESYSLDVQEEECTPVLNIPNVFTPNGDGFNDILELRTAEKIFDFEIKIYNTYGRLVHQYKGEPTDFRWDGFSKLLAQPLPDGTYYWIALFRDYLNKKKKENGIITILR